MTLTLGVCFGGNLDRGPPPPLPGIRVLAQSGWPLLWTLHPPKNCGKYYTCKLGLSDKNLEPTVLLSARNSYRGNTQVEW